jgi:putative peptide zinc metalloprotease protein
MDRRVSLLWRALRSNSPAGVWAEAAIGARRKSESRCGLWAWIQERIDLAFYRPQQAGGVVASRLNGREGVYYVLRAPDGGSYLKLTEEDYFLWTQMNGQRTVKDLVVAYFSRFGAFAFGRVGQLVRALRQGGFLTDRPVGVMAHAQAELDGRELASRGERLVSAFLDHEIVIHGVDDFLGRLYRYTFWLFAPLTQILLLLVVVAGLVFFVDTLVGGEVPLLTVGDSYWLGLIALLVIHAVIIVIHELAHGLTTKHFGRQVRRGGFLIYYGYPAFFVDTMDMWLEGRRARIAVSWAGPHSGLVVGGLCASLVHFFPGAVAGPWLFKTAFVAYLSVFFNLNPLLELDGYFILIDLLDIPMLRQRAFSFVRHQLWGELRDAWRKRRQGMADWRAGFNQEERLLAVFGLLAAAYTLYSLWVALYFWQTRVIIALRELWNRPGWISKLLLILVLSLVIIPLGAALLAQLLAWLRRGLAWLEERGFFERDRNIVLSLLALLTLLTLGPTMLGEPWWGRYLAFVPPLLFTVALVALWRTIHRYRGAEFQRVFWALAATVGVLWLAALLRASVGAKGDEETIILLAYNLERLAALPLVLAGFFGLTGVDLRRGALWERVTVAVLIVAAGLIVMPVSRWTADMSFLGAVLSVAAPYLSLIFLAMILPNLAAFARTRFMAAWLALIAAAILTGSVGLARAMPNPPAPTSDLDRWLALLCAGLWALGAVLYDVTAQRVRFERAEWAEAQVISDEERLRQAFARFFAALFDSFRETFGARRAQAVDDELDVMAVTADWDVEIDGGRVNDELDLSRMTLWEQADRYREVLARTVDLIDDWAGRLFVARAAQAAYDSLPWPEREVLGRYVLVGTDWGAAIAARFAAHQGMRRRLVRAVPLFAHCSKRALDLIVAALESKHVPVGRVLARQGAPVDCFMLVQSGEIQVWRRDRNTGTSQLVGELRRGATLGDETFFGVGHYDATYRASVPSELLILDAATCGRLVRSGVALATRVGASLKVVRLLSGMPLFSHLSPQQLSALANQMRRRVTLGRQVVAHKGAERHSLFIVVEGEVEALADDAEGNKIVAHVYTPGEHLGEYALFADTPYQFTYRTRGPATLLTLDEATFDALVAQSERMASYVEQVGSGRLLGK